MCRWASSVRAGGALLAIVSAAVLGMTSCGGAAQLAQRPHDPQVARSHPAGSVTAVLAGPPDLVAAGVAKRLLASAPVVVIASPHRLATLLTAARWAVRVHAPLLLAAAQPDRPVRSARPGGSSSAAPQAGDRVPGASDGEAALISAVTRAEARSLHPREVLDVGVGRAALAAELPGIRVVSDPARLPATEAPAPLTQVALLIRQRDSGAAALAADTTARVAGARVIPVRGDDPRADPAAIGALSAARPRRVVAIGAGFGPPGRLAARIAVAETGVQLPGGGQTLFPARRLVALYGHPGAPTLGALGQQGLPASIARARDVAAQYRPLSTLPVIPAFEIIATVAQASPGREGSYSSESSVALLRPWVRRATAAGMYVVLDLQPGRASLLTQAEKYQPLLKLPAVGLALDPEWKLGPSQRPLHQIGSVGISEVNSVISWLARLTARYHLPQKLLVLHQFRLSMIQGEERLDTRHDDLAIVLHMDGQGTPGEKQQTWDAVTGAAPAGVFFGWKNFYVKDLPMMSPQQTMTRTPQPLMISYQ